MADPADRVTLAESVSMAMMVVLETLSPAERTAFILHDVFGYEFPEIAVATGRGATSATGRSASTRIRRRVAASPTPSSPRPPAATSTGCWPCSIRTPSSAATAGALRGPPGGRWSAPTGLPGSCSESWPRRPGGPVRIQPIEVNGQPGFASFEGDVLRFIAGLHVAGGRVVEINIVANPEKMRHLSDAALVREAVPVGEPRATNTRR